MDVREEEDSLKGHFCSQNRFFFILDSISRRNSKTPHVLRIPDFGLKPAQILGNVPSPVLAKSVGDLRMSAIRTCIIS